MAWIKNGVDDLENPRGNNGLLLIAYVVGLYIWNSILWASLAIPTIGLLYYLKPTKPTTIKKFPFGKYYR